MHGCLIEKKIDYFGNDLEYFTHVLSKEACSKRAAEVEKAKFWTYHLKSKTCYTKTSKEGKKAHPNVVSGNVECANGQEGEFQKGGSLTHLVCLFERTGPIYRTRALCVFVNGEFAFGFLELSLSFYGRSNISDKFTFHFIRIQIFQIDFPLILYL